MAKKISELDLLPITPTGDEPFPLVQDGETYKWTIALLAALGQDEEVAMHVRATANTGATKDDIREALMHVAVYAGVPAANHAFKIVKKVLAEMELDASEAGAKQGASHVR